MRVVGDLGGTRRIAASFIPLSLSTLSEQGHQQQGPIVRPKVRDFRHPGNGSYASSAWSALCEAGVMDTSFVYPSAGKDDVAPKGLPGASVDPSAAAADQSDRACCCPAKAVVQVVIPPTPTRPHPTDLLLCGHHYRVSRRALAAGRAVVHELPGMPRDTAAWIYHDHDRSLAPVECANLSSGRAAPRNPR